MYLFNLVNNKILLTPRTHPQRLDANNFQQTSHFSHQEFKLDFYSNVYIIIMFWHVIFAASNTIITNLPRHIQQITLNLHLISSYDNNYRKNERNVIVFVGINHLRGSFTFRPLEYFTIHKRKCRQNRTTPQNPLTHYLKYKSEYILRPIKCLQTIEC